MVRKSLLFLMFLAFIMLASYAYSAPVYQGYLFNGENFTLDNHTYILNGQGPDEYWMTYTTLVLKKIGPEPDLLTVKLGKCVSTEYYLYCYDESKYDFDKKHTYEGTRIEPLMHIKVDHQLPIIAIDRTASLIVNRGEKTPVPVKIKNTGTNDIVVSYREEFPAGIIPSDCTNCNLINNVLTKRAYLTENEEAAFEYWLTTNDYQKKSWNAKYSYTIDSGLKELTTPVSVSVNNPFMINDGISKSSTKSLDDHALYALFIENKDYYDSMHAEAVIYVQNAKVLSYNNLLDQGSGYYVYKGLIRPRTVKNFTLDLTADVVGTYPLIANITARILNESSFRNNRYSYTVSLAGVTPSITFNRVKLVPGDNMSIVLRLKNNEAEEVYFNIFASLSGFGEIYFKHPSIMPGKDTVVYNNTFIVPGLPNSSIIVFEFSGVYYTLNNQEFRFSTKKDLKVESSIPPIPVIIKNSSSQATNNINTSQGNANANNATTPNNSGNLQNNTQNTAQNNQNNVQAEDQDLEKEETDEDNPEEKKDILTGFFDGINKFFESIFGKKK